MSGPVERGEGRGEGFSGVRGKEDGPYSLCCRIEKGVNISCDYSRRGEDEEQRRKTAGIVLWHTVRFSEVTLNEMAHPI